MKFAADHLTPYSIPQLMAEREHACSLSFVCRLASLVAGFCASLWPWQLPHPG